MTRHLCGIHRAKYGEDFSNCHEGKRTSPKVTLSDVNHAVLNVYVLGPVNRGDKRNVLRLNLLTCMRRTECPFWSLIR